MTGEGLVVWGAAGHALVLADFVGDLGYRIDVLVDRDPDIEPPLADVPVVVGIDGLDRWLAGIEPSHRPRCFAVAIGGSRGADRLEVHELLEQRGLEAATLVHPAAHVARSGELGAGSQVLAGAVVGAAARLGRQCIVNTGATVDHECVLGDGVHIGPGATLAGCVIAGDEAFVGTGAAVLPRVRIGARAVVGAGAVVIADVEPDTTVVGVPARPPSARPARA